MGIRSRFFAATYDGQMRRAERAGLTDMRRALLAQAAGRVLEIGGGTGANLAHYGPAVTSLTITEPEVSMLKRLERRVRRRGARDQVLRAPAEDLPFEDGTFDVVVSTLVLCGVDDQPRAVREIRRVLRPGGRLLFLEHVRSDRPHGGQEAGPHELAEPAGRLLRLQPAYPRHHRGRRLPSHRLEHTELPKAPSFVRPAIVGIAVSPTGAGLKASIPKPISVRRLTPNPRKGAVPCPRYRRRPPQSSATSVSPRTGRGARRLHRQLRVDPSRRDLAPMLKGLPGERCRAHTGDMFSREDDSPLRRPRGSDRGGRGLLHDTRSYAAATAGTEFVQFSPTDQLAVSEAVMAKNMQEMQGGR